jgi:hypothetical protein
MTQPELRAPGKPRLVTEARERSAAAKPQNAQLLSINSVSGTMLIAATLAAFGAAVAAPVTDGARYAAIQRDSTTIEVRDDALGKRRTLLIPAGCSVRSLSRSGVLMAGCGGDVVLTIDLGTGARDQYVTPALLDLGSRYAKAAGREWIEEYIDGYHWSAVQYRSRTTCEVRTADGEQEAVDLDSPGLVTSFCRPLKRFAVADPHDPYDSRPPFEPMAFDGKVGYSGTRFWRCGHAKAQSIPGYGLTASAGWVTTFTGSGGPDSIGAVAQRLRDGRRTRLRVPRVEGARYSLIAHTARAVYVSRQTGDGGHRIFRVRLPSGS